MSTASTIASLGVPARPSASSAGLRRLALIAVAALVLTAAWFVGSERPYKAGSDLGYGMGVVGGSMMLVLLLYPLRKHFKLFQRLGAVRHWFSMHMAFGILGPLLILFHSTFHLGSLNGKIALISMLLVAGSGVVGRFIYVHIHHGLYGRAATLEEMRERLARSEEEAETLFALTPEIRDRLLAFHDLALDSKTAAAQRVWRFMTLRLRGRLLLRGLRRAFRMALDWQGAESGWTPAQQRTHYRLARREAAAYVAAVCGVAQFQAWKRLFSFWHVAHVPFVFLLIGSGIAHVVAVHLY